MASVQSSYNGIPDSGVLSAVETWALTRCGRATLLSPRPACILLARAGWRACGSFGRVRRRASAAHRAPLPRVYRRLPSRVAPRALCGCAVGCGGPARLLGLLLLVRVEVEVAQEVAAL